MSPVTPRDLPVPLTKGAAMRYLAELAGHGYVLYQHGEVPKDKAVALVEKFDIRYRVLAARGAREHARSSGRAVARLVMYPKDGDASAWLFWLLATEGQGLLTAESSTRDARMPATRVPWGEQYELVARPVQRRGVGLRHVWTWVMSDTAYAGWQSRLKTAGPWSHCHKYVHGQGREGMESHSARVPSHAPRGRSRRFRCTHSL